MSTTKNLPEKSIWKPQFIEEINRDICLDCGRFNEIGGRHTFNLRTIDNSNNSEQQITTVANPQECADCDACTSIYPEPAYTHYSFSI
jgi:ferredoxin